MAFGKNLIFLLPFLLVFSCAQVGEISGGDEDTYAPKPVEGKTMPPNESSNFQGKSVEITFDEYVQLNKPQQTVVFVPNHAKPKTTLHKKTIKIEWEETLQENTTYVIYLNGTVKDVTESNDSLMYYVFSTGVTLDSLKYSVRVVDAWTNQAIKDATVGLFTHKDSLKPYYFANSNSFGEANFSFLKAGTYFLKAFMDENKDLQIQASEKIAFKSNSIVIDSSINDSIPLRIYKPKEKNKIRTFKYVAPSNFLIGANYPIKDADFYINSTKIEKEFIQALTKDSVRLFTSVVGLSEVQLVVKTKDHSDTISTRLTEKEKIAKIQLLPDFKGQQVGPHEAVSFQIHDLIQNVDSSKIQLTNPLDSTRIPFKASFQRNQLIIDFASENYKQADLIIQTGAIETILNQTNDSLKTLLIFSSVKDYGSIILDVSEFQEPIIVELLKGTKLIQQILLDKPNKYTFSNLNPGEYQFRIIADVNENGIWDSGNFSRNEQAETVYWYSTVTKVRANWDIDVQLSPTK